MTAAAIFTAAPLRRSGKIDEVKDSISSAKIWAFGLYMALAAALLGVMAHGFGWI